MPGPASSLAYLTDTGVTLYGRGWQTVVAREFNLPLRSITRWCSGGPLADIRHKLADLCRRTYDPNMERMARKLESLGPPE